MRSERTTSSRGGEGDNKTERPDSPETVGDAANSDSGDCGSEPPICPESSADDDDVVVEDEDEDEEEEEVTVMTSPSEQRSKSDDVNLSTTDAPLLTGMVALSKKGFVRSVKKKGAMTTTTMTSPTEQRSKIDDVNSSTTASPLHPEMMALSTMGIVRSNKTTTVTSPTEQHLKPEDVNSSTTDSHLPGFVRSGMTTCSSSDSTVSASSEASESLPDETVLCSSPSQVASTATTESALPHSLPSCQKSSQSPKTMNRKRKSEEVKISLPCKKLLFDDAPSSSSKRKSPESNDKQKPSRSPVQPKDTPPPEITDWLLQFQRWSNAERIMAIDRLVETCEPSQVRHMMNLIEPQFQRDFISLLPKELALLVLSFLEPKDLLRAAQTCRNWRFLAEDNLLWREKCRQAGITRDTTSHSRPRRHRSPSYPAAPWKAAFMRQHRIEMNWRVKPIRPAKVLKGHDDHVITCLQFSGSRIVSGSDDNTLKVWSATTGKCLRTLVGHTGGVWSSQMSGSTIISGSTDRTLKVWNAETGQCIHTLYGHTSTVRCMHLHGKKVVSGSRDATLRVWHIESGECLHVLVGHLAAVRCVQYDGRLVVSGAYDYMVKVWNPEREECLHTLQGHTNRVYSLQFDGVHVVSGSLDTSIRVWEVETGQCRHTLMGHQSLTSGMELNNNILVSGNADSTVKVWDILTGQCLQTLSGANKHQSAVTCLQFNNRFVITSSDDGTVKLWDVKTGEFIRNLVALDSGGSGGVVWRIRANETKLVCAVGSRNATEETKLLVLDFDVEAK